MSDTLQVIQGVAVQQCERAQVRRILDNRGPRLQRQLQ